MTYVDGGKKNFTHKKIVKQFFINDFNCKHRLI